MDGVEQLLCKVTFGELCKLSVDAICGISKLDDKQRIVDMTSHFPAGTSVKDLTHYEQFIGEWGKPARQFFGEYDYGASGNNAQYGQPDPPAYEMSKFAIKPTAMFLAANDDLVAAADCAELQRQLPPEVIVFNKTYQGFSHLTWVVGVQQSWGWLDDLTQLLGKYNPTN